MCLPIDCWLCTPHTDDNYHAPATKHGAPQPAPASKHGGHHYNGNGGHYSGYGNGGHYNGNGYPAAAGAEADRKASNAVRRGPAAHAVPTEAGATATTTTTRGWHGHAATGAQEKQADGTLKQPAVARNDKVAAAGARGVVAHSYYYYERELHKEDAADSYYPTTPATADHERY